MSLLRKFFCGALLWQGTVHAVNELPHPLEDPRELPFGIFPSIQRLKGSDEGSLRRKNLGEEIQGLSESVSDTVKIMAERRNLSCLRRPCLIQAFPLAYEKKGSGFFGGARINIRDISRFDPPNYNFKTQFARSDKQEWTSFMSLDFPRLEFIPLQPRLRFRFDFDKNTENHFFGSGRSSLLNESRTDTELRYGIRETGASVATFIPLAQFNTQKLQIYSAFQSKEIRTRRYRRHTGSVLFEEKPRGYKGGVNQTASLGFILDGRDREDFTRKGSSFEFTGETSGQPEGQFRYQRLTYVEKHYARWSRYSVAFRGTADFISGEEPFWANGGVGGVDPIFDVSGSGILRGYDPGRFHERQKYMGSAELRYDLSPKRYWGQYTEVAFIPLGIDVARLGNMTAYSYSAGYDLLFRNTLLVRIYASLAQTGASLNLKFDSEY